MELAQGIVGLVAFFALMILGRFQYAFNRLELLGMAKLLHDLGLVHDPVPTISRLPSQAAEFGDATPL